MVTLWTRMEDDFLMEHSWMEVLALCPLLRVMAMAHQQWVDWYSKNLTIELKLLISIILKQLQTAKPFQLEFWECSHCWVTLKVNKFCLDHTEGKICCLRWIRTTLVPCHRATTRHRMWIQAKEISIFQLWLLVMSDKVDKLLKECLRKIKRELFHGRDNEVSISKTLPSRTCSEQASKGNQRSKRDKEWRITIWRASGDFVLFYFEHSNVYIDQVSVDSLIKFALHALV